MTNNLFINIKELEAQYKTNSWMDEIVDYEAPYDMSDVLAQMADMNTSIYYSDIQNFIAEHLDEVEAAINEFGWTGNIYQAGQNAEYTHNYNMLNENLSNLLALWAIDYLQSEYNMINVPSAMWAMILVEIGDGYWVQNLRELAYIVDMFYKDFTEN